jgi:hypothetical protein
MRVAIQVSFARGIIFGLRRKRSSHRDRFNLCAPVNTYCGLCQRELPACGNDDHYGGATAAPAPPLPSRSGVATESGVGNAACSGVWQTDEAAGHRRLL